MYKILEKLDLRVSSGFLETSPAKSQKPKAQA